MPEDPAISVLSRSKNAAARTRPLALGRAAGSGARPALSPAGARGATERGCESGIGPALGLDPQDHRVALAPARADRCAAQPAAVVDARRVAGRVRSVLACEPGKGGELLERGVAARPLVDLHDHVSLAPLDRHGDDLLGQPPLVG